MCSVTCAYVNSATPWATAYETPLSTEFSRQECWSGCHFLLQGIFLTQRSNVSCIGRQILYHCASWEAPLPPDLRTCKNQHWYLEPFSPQALMSVQFTLLCSKWFIPQVTQSHEIWITMSFYSTCGGGLVTKSCLTLATPWTVAHRTPLSMEFSRQEYSWNTTGSGYSTYVHI